MTLNVFSSLSKYCSSTDENYLTESLVFLIKLLLKRMPEEGGAAMRGKINEKHKQLKE